METISVAIVDDQVHFRQGIIALLQEIQEVKIIADAEDAPSMLKALEALKALPDILLMDMEMPGMSGIELNRIIRQLYPNIKVIMLTLFEQERYVFKMVEEGVCGYLSKNCNKEELQEAIHKVYESGFFFTERIKTAMQHASETDPKNVQNIARPDVELTNREKEILQLICQEYTNVEIGEQLFISPRTVEGHRNNLLLKTGSKNTAGLVVFAIKNHIYDINNT